MTCHNGYQALSGWWEGGCGDQRGNFYTGPEGKWGRMKSNASGVRRFITTGGAEGDIFLELWFPTNRVPTGRGQHIMGVVSAHEGLGSPRGKFYFGWLRFDFQIQPTLFGDPILRIGTYNVDGGGDPWMNDIVVDTWNSPIVLRPAVLIPIRFQWRRLDPENIAFYLNGTYHAVRIHPDSENPIALSFGNMDDLETFGGIPEVWFRDFQELP